MGFFYEKVSVQQNQAPTPEVSPPPLPDPIISNRDKQTPQPKRCTRSAVRPRPDMSKDSTEPVEKWQKVQYKNKRSANSAIRPRPDMSKDSTEPVQKKQKAPCKN